MGRDKYKRNKFDKKKQQKPWSNNKNSNYNKNTYRKRTWDHIPQEQLKEADVGITEYLSTLPGFSGVIKARFSDFHVHEIDSDGLLVKLTDTSFPEEYKKYETSLAATVPTKMENPSKHISDESWNEIVAMLESDDKDATVQVDVTNLSKECRSEIYSDIRSLSRTFVANTVNKEDKRFMQFKKFDKDVKENRLVWPKELGKYVHFVLYKEAIDTLEATLKISDCVKLKSSLFTYAGVKDRRAKTTQRFSVMQLPPWKLLKFTKPLRNIHIGNITFKDEPLKLGQLKGNRFQVALRNVTAERDVIDKALEHLREHGFINYYGLQRFGNDKEVSTFEIGIKLLQSNWKEACDLILKPKKAEDPTSDITAAKKVYQDTSDAKKAYDTLTYSKNKCVEAKLLYGLSLHNGKDYVNSLEQIPRNMRLLYIHSFQSLIWNKIVSRRIKEHGIKPIVGDLVFVPGKEQTDTKIEIDADEPDVKPEVEPITEENLGNYTIYDIVLPMPGYDVKYPENDVKTWYKELLDEVGLSLEMTKQAVKTYNLSGAYRYVFGRVTDLSWHTIRYNNPNDNLIRSDFEELLGRAEPVDDPNGSYTALVVDFRLNASSYATMVLRDVLKTGTSAAEHAKLNNYTVEYSQPKSLLSKPEDFAKFKDIVYSTSEKRPLDDEAQSEDVVQAKKIKEHGNDEGRTAVLTEPSLI